MRRDLIRGATGQRERVVSEDPRHESQRHLHGARTGGLCRRDEPNVFAMELLAEAHEVALTIAEEARDDSDADSRSDGFGEGFGIVGSDDSRRLACELLEPTKARHVGDAIRITDDAVLGPFFTLGWYRVAFRVG